MSRSAALRSARHLALGSALLTLLVVATTAPVAAWQVAGPHAASVNAEARPATAPGRHPAAAAGAPVDDPDEALAAGGRRAAGPRSRTVVRFGVDVSHWQGHIDWDKVARSGIQFAIAKATEGTWMVDPWYLRNRARAQKAGIRFTAYHYANPNRRPGDAVREADWFLRNAKLTGTNLLPALDLEESGGLSPAELKRWTLQWMRRVERKLGVRPMLYTSPGFWSGWVANTPDVARAGFDALWLSHWQTRQPSIPGKRWAGTGWTFWQWTERGRVPGVAHWVDRNVYSGPKLLHMTIREIRRHGAPGDGDKKHDVRPQRPKPH